MKLQITKQTLETLSKVTKLGDNTIHFKVENGGFTATSLVGDTYIRHTSDNGGLEEGYINVFQSEIESALKSFKSRDFITIETFKQDDEIKGTISQGLIKIPLLFPLFKEVELPKLNAEAFNIPYNEFKRVFDTCLPFIAKNNPKLALNCWAIDITEKNINFCSTNTRALTIASLENYSLNPTEKPLLVTSTAIKALKVLFKTKVPLNISYDWPFISFKIGNFEVLSGVNDTFPNYGRIKQPDENFHFQAVLNKNDFLAPLSQLKNCNDAVLRLDYSSDGVTFTGTTNNQEVIYIDEQVVYSEVTKPSDGKIFIDPEILEKLLKVLPNDTFTIKIADAKNPYVVTFEDVYFINMPVYV